MRKLENNASQYLQLAEDLQLQRQRQAGPGTRQAAEELETGMLLCHHSSLEAAGASPLAPSQT